MGKALKVTEIVDKRLVRDIIYSFMDKDEAWANAHFALIRARVKDNTLFNLISESKLHNWLKTNRKLHHNTHFVFLITATSQQENQQFDRGQGDGDFSFQRQQPQECLCGLVHWWVNCTYFNSAKQLYGQQVDSETIRQVDKAIKNTDTKQYVENIIKRVLEKKYQNQNNQNNQTNQN